MPTQAQILSRFPARNFRQSGYSGFFEDTWRVRPRLTVDLGLRYEYFTPLGEKNNLIGTWDPTVGFEQVGVNTNHPYNPDSKDFSPRVGLAWDVTGKGTTVLHVGAGRLLHEYHYRPVGEQQGRCRKGLRHHCDSYRLLPLCGEWRGYGSAKPNERRRLGHRNHSCQPAQLESASRTGTSRKRGQQLCLRRWHRSH